ncbi:ribokinase [Williamsia limnetica]|uniref:Ribokinase n=1 Tax=Williamsia limnetica TaxID=882452 RepID=A0A318RM55_WILLI|nr:PfkB family carbohydrate kinase [Williamsia limnetica]PYE12227.1 ribokinase [Williamsia limnetica]
MATNPVDTRVIVVGAINVDFVIATVRLPGPGETVVGPRVDRHGGGKGANAAVAAARAGASVELIGAAGADDTGDGALTDLRDDGVDVGAVVRTDAPTGVALIVVDQAGENQIAVGAGANAELTAEQVRDSLTDLRPGDCVLISTEIPGAAVLAAVETAAAAGARCVVNPAPPIPEIADAVQYGPILTPNAGECLELAGMLGADSDTVEEAATALSEATGSAVVVTLGGDGLLVGIPGHGVERIPARAATVRDTTGAGDTFNGVFAARLAAGDTTNAAATVANVAAAMSVSYVGARTGMPTWDQISATSR